METHPVDLDFTLDDDLAVSKVPARYLDLVDVDLENETRTRPSRGYNSTTSNWGE
jgi:hypothetical protein